MSEEKINFDVLIEKVNKKYKGDKAVPYMGNNSLPDPKSEFEYDKDRVTVIKKCQEDIKFFAEHFFYIITSGKKEKIKLRPYQINGLECFQKYNKTIFNTSRQIGKALALDTPIPTVNGWTTMGELKDGDVVYDEKGKPCNVLCAHDILYNRECYEVGFDCGEKIIVDGEHLWFTQTRAERKRGCNGSVKTTTEIIKNINTGKKRIEPNHRIRKCHGVEGIKKDLIIDPYLLGLWLGDGHKGAAIISVGGSDLEQFLDVLPWKKYSILEDKRNDVRYISLLKDNGCIFSHMLKNVGVLNKKNIPEMYLNSSRNQRLELLMGLMDTDGTVRTDGGCQIDLSDYELVIGVESLIKSLGYKCNVKKRYPKNNKHKISYRLAFMPHEYVFKYKRKLKLQKLCDNHNRINYHYIKYIKKVDSVPVRCITVNSESSLYLCGKNYIPTHNTTLMGIYVVWLTVFFEHRKVLVVANKADTAKEILSRIKLAFEELPNWIKPGVVGWNKLSVEFKNGSEVKISATSADAARGLSLNCLSGESEIEIIGQDGLIYDVSLQEMTHLNEGLKTNLRTK